MKREHQPRSGEASWSSPSNGTVDPAVPGSGMLGSIGGHFRQHASALRSTLSLGILLAILPAPAHAQHRHINAGAESQIPGSPLVFVNAGLFAPDSGLLIHLTATNTTDHGLIYKGGGDVTFTSLPATADNGGPDAHAALPGTRIEAVMVSLTGPEGGALSFWDSFDGFFEATEMTSTLRVGTTNGSQRFALSENDGSVGADPYGHIHGRKFSVDLPGRYTLGLRLVDASTNGHGGTPMHAPSDVAYFQFQAGLTLGPPRRFDGGIAFNFGSESGRTYVLETSGSVRPGAAWTTVGGPVAGTGGVVRIEVPSTPTDTAFFRLRAE